MGEFINLFNDSLKTGFIDKNLDSELLYQPKLLVNSIDPKKKILSSILQEFQTCESFFISVAFVTTGGVATIINVLQELRERNVKGKIIVSQYLNFTEPEALRRLLQFENIELKIATNVNAHSKGYLFKKNNHYNLIVGSSNLTQTALSSNKEWNLQVSAIENGKIIEKVLHEFESDFNSAIDVTAEFIIEYEEIYLKKRVGISLAVENKENQSVFEPNSMQVEALKNLYNIRKEQKTKALIISATGTGKTYLSAFDAKAFNPTKLLFVVHRLNIAKKAMETFKKVFGDQKSMGIYSGNIKEKDKDFLFSTVQTISKEDHLNVFSKDHFNYIIIDESHRSGAQSYINLVNYFSPKFLLGMTATPERTDGHDIFKLFDHNIAYEIRLNKAMEAQLLCPFHYYGVSDLYIEGENKDDFKLFNRLTSNERVDKIISMSSFYGTDNGICRGLIFASRIEEAKEISVKLNHKGYKTIALSGENSEEERTQAIELLESENEYDKLDYIITVDIFNEGIDIPKLNQIIMLRPTESAVVFVQQLGRGLRKFDTKSYLTVIDFIGNHSNNYLIPIALYGDASFNKDRLRKLMEDGSTELPGVSTINFDRISKEEIFKSLDKANMRLLKDLKKEYFLLKYRLGRFPMMMDFVKSNSRDPFLFVKYSKSYYNFIAKVESDFNPAFSKEVNELLNLFSLEINNGKRIEESIIMRELLNDYEIKVFQLKQLIAQDFGYQLNDETIKSAISNLNFAFLKKNKKVAIRDDDTIRFNPEFISKLKNETFRKFLLDSIEYSIHSFAQSFAIQNFVDGFTLYQKYSRKDVCRILNWEKDISSTVYGYRTNKSSTPCFVTYHKSDEIENSIKYNDHFISPSVFAWESRSNRKVKSPEIQNVINCRRILLFVKKADSEGTEFYYMGDASIVPGSIEQSKMPDSGLPVVHFKFKLDKAVPESLYSYITDSYKKISTQIKTELQIVENVKLQPSEKVVKIPFYNLYAAAGSFSEMQTSKEFTLIDVPGKYSDGQFFAIKVLGESMNRRIPNGSICIFKQPVVGSRSDKILLIEYFNRQDQDLQSHFTVKTYSSTKTITDEGWRHESIILKPNSFDSSYENIVISEEDIKENQFNVIGEFVEVL